MDYSIFLVVEQVKPGQLNIEEIQEKLRFRRNCYLSTRKDEIYHIGIIDYIQLWNKEKQVENIFKRCFKGHNSLMLSAVHPNIYQARFIQFVYDDILMVSRLCPENDKSCRYLDMDQTKIEKQIMKWSMLWIALLDSFNNTFVYDDDIMTMDLKIMNWLIKI